MQTLIPTLRAICALAPLPRFVFVMSVLENHSTRECSLLLGCTMETVTEARNSALNPKSSESDQKSYVLAAAHPMPLTA